MSTSLKGLVWIVVAGVALSLAILAGLPGMAEAQEVETQTLGTASTEAEQNTTTDDEKGAPAAWRPAPESSTTRLVVEPGDSLWSISEEHIGPGATPKQIAYEVERTFDLNRERIGGNPNLIFPGQEFVLLPPASDTAAAAVSQDPVAAQQAPKPIVVQSEGVSDSPVAEHAVSQEAVPENGASGGAVSEDAVPAPPTRGQTDEQAENASAENASAESVPDESVPSTTAAAGGIAGSLLEVYDNIKVERRLLGIGILALTLIVAILMALRLPMRRNVEGPAAWGIPQDYYENYARPEAPLEASSETSPETSHETARKPEGEPSSSPASVAPPEEPTGGPATSTSGTNNTNTSSSPTGETEGALPVGAVSAAEAARSRERLRRARYLRSIRQRQSPPSW